MTRLLAIASAAALVLASPAAASTKTIKKDARALSKVVHAYNVAMDAHGAEFDSALDAVTHDLDGCQADVAAAKASDPGKLAVLYVRIYDFSWRVLAIGRGEIESANGKLKAVKLKDRDIKAFRNTMLKVGAADVAHPDVTIDACAALRAWAQNGYDPKHPPGDQLGGAGAVTSGPKYSAKGLKKLQQAKLSKRAFSEIVGYDTSTGLNQRAAALVKSELGA